METTVLPGVTTSEATGDLLAKVSLIAAAAATTLDGPAASEPVTLDEAKAHLRVIGTDEDDYITGLITAAREMAEGRLNRTIARRTRTDVFASWREDLVLAKPPVVSVDGVTYVDDTGTVQVLGDDMYHAAVYLEPAVVELAPGFQGPALHFRRHPIAVTYTAGYADGDVPRAICQWILLAIGALYQNRESMVTGVSVTELPEGFMALLIQPYRVYE